MLGKMHYFGVIHSGFVTPRTVSSKPLIVLKLLGMACKKQTGVEIRTVVIPHHKNGKKSM